MALIGPTVIRYHQTSHIEDNRRMVLIGSTAIRYHQISQRTPNDVDVIMTLDDLRVLQQNSTAIRTLVPLTYYKYVLKTSTGLRYDISLNVHPTDTQLLEMSSEWEDVYHDKHLNIDLKVPPIEWMMLIKRSHLHCDVQNFEKNIAEYHTLKAEVVKRGIVLTNEQHAFLQARTKESEAHFAYRAPSLNMSNDAFFETSSEIVGYEFVHDDLHEVLKHDERPIYEKMKHDQSLAKCDKDLFFDYLTKEERLKSVLEEAYVIATERYLLKEDISPRNAFVKALGRICTNLCSGFFRDYAIENYFSALVEYDEDYADKVVAAYARGKLTPRLDEGRVEKAMRTLRRNIAEH